MDKKLTDEQLSLNPKISQPMRDLQYDKVMEDIEKGYNDGKSIETLTEELFKRNMMDRVISEQDIIDYYNKQKAPEEEEGEKENEDEKIEDYSDMEKISDNVLENIKNKELEKEDIEKKAGELVTAVRQEQREKNIMDIEDEHLFDFENQDFPMYDEEERENMKRSIALHGIIERLIVRPIKDKPGDYQIISGRNRRQCGREIGMKKFPCIVRYDLTDDDVETELLLIDTNITTRKDLQVMDKAKVLKRKKELLDSKNYQTKIKNLRNEAEGDPTRHKIVPVFDSLQEEFNLSRGNIQTLLRLNELVDDLQYEVRGGMSAEVGEQLSFLDKQHQREIANMLKKNEKLKISKAQAKKLRLINNNKELDKNKIQEILLGKADKEKLTEDEKIIKLEFKREELEKVISKLVEESKEITDENIKNKIIETINIL